MAVCFFLLVFARLLFLNHAVTIQMNSNISGQIGSNGTKLICTFNILKADVFYAMNFRRYDSNIVIINTQGYTFTDFGKYLEGRVLITDIIKTFTNETNKAFEAMIIFTNLQCIDDGNYTCELTYGDSTNDFNVEKTMSRTASVIVKAIPSRPSTISIFRHLREITTPPRNNSVRISSTPVAIPNNDEEEYLEDDNVTIYCSGDVGRPPANLTIHKIQSGEIVEYNTDGKIKYTGNCSFYQNISVTINLNAKDNGVIFRCAASPFNHEEGLFIETSPIVVQYAVKMPVVRIDPQPWTSPPIRLSCLSQGNPLPDYTWYRAEDNRYTYLFTLYSNAQNITLDNVTDSGIYKCDVNNTVGQNVFRRSRNVTIELKAKPLIITKVPHQTSYIAGTPRVELTCLTSSFPTSIYFWILPNRSLVTGKTVVITDVQERDGGLYTCLLVNTEYANPRILTSFDTIIIEQHEHKHRHDVGHLSIKNHVLIGYLSKCIISKLGDPDITKCQCTQNNNHVPAIIGSVFSTLGLCLATWGIIYLFRRSRLKNKSDSDQIRQMTPMDHQVDTPNYEGVSGNLTEHHYDDLRQRQDHHNVYTHLQAKRC